MKTRRQLTLFLNPNSSEKIEEFRLKYNPIQHHLIAAHLTLCRENEIENLDKILQNLEKINFKSIEMKFGKPERFENKKGLWLTSISQGFNVLREEILVGIIAPNQKAHITLMHPRNSTCTNEIYETAKHIIFPEIIHFDSIALIEQKNGEKWEILKILN
jgi:hypothetical protein